MAIFRTYSPFRPWRPENFVIVYLTIHELSCLQQTDRQTNTQTDTTEKHTSLAMRLVTRQVKDQDRNLPENQTENTEKETDFVCLLLATWDISLRNDK